MILGVSTDSEGKTVADGEYVKPFDGLMRQKYYNRKILIQVIVARFFSDIV